MNPTPIPLRDRMVAVEREEYRREEARRMGRRDPLEGTITNPWIQYFSELNDVVYAGPERKATVTLTNQSASIGATAISPGDLAGGLYRVQWYARITQAATTSSSLTVTFGWTETSISLSYSGSAITGNTTSTFQANDSIFVRIDTSTPLTYATTYASVGATPMRYRLDITLESVAV